MIGKKEGLSIVEEELNRLRERIIANHRAAGQVASGRTIASLSVEILEDGGVLYGRSAFGTVELGRRGGKTPANFQSIIRQWILDKGLHVEPIPYVRRPSERWQPKYTPYERGLLSMSGAISEKIRKGGTKLYRDGGRKDIYSNEIPDTISRIGDRLGYLFDKEVESINDKFTRS